MVVGALWRELGVLGMEFYVEYAVVAGVCCCQLDQKLYSG